MLSVKHVCLSCSNCWPSQLNPDHVFEHRWTPQHMFIWSLEPFVSFFNGCSTFVKHVFFIFFLKIKRDNPHSKATNANVPCPRRRPPLCAAWARRCGARSACCASPISWSRVTGRVWAMWAVLPCWLIRDSMGILGDSMGILGDYRGDYMGN